MEKLFFCYDDVIVDFDSGALWQCIGRVKKSFLLRAYQAPAKLSPEDPSIIGQCIAFGASLSSLSSFDTLPTSAAVSVVGALNVIGNS